MMPKVIMHNSVSVDGSVIDFDVNMEVHYQIAGRHNADVHLVGSQTGKKGIELFLDEVPAEEKGDFKRPEINPDDRRPLWVIPDSRGIMKGLLHIVRRSEYCKDVLILVSKKTPSDYLEYLKERNYEYLVVGEDHVEMRKSFEMLAERYGVKTILVDSGGILTSILLEEDLVDEVSLLVSPYLVGKKSQNLFRSLRGKKGSIKLELLESDTAGKNHVLLRYKVIR
jgi:2,5-diamino-6-(ribosylamino)-4(3H)-pyrimidinone 5'-phosphate reductase